MQQRLVTWILKKLLLKISTLFFYSFLLSFLWCSLLSTKVADNSALLREQINYDTEEDYTENHSITENHYITEHHYITDEKQSLMPSRDTNAMSVTMVLTFPSSLVGDPGGSYRMQFPPTTSAEMDSEQRFASREMWVCDSPYIFISFLLFPFTQLSL